MDTNKKVLILRYGSYHDDTGIRIQEEVYKKHNLENERSTSNMKAQPNELWIFLKWINTGIGMEEVQELSRQALSKRYR